MGGADLWRLGHRPALDGLRGFAILLVLAHHARVPGTASTGMIGVTLFFVLSGFLITGLLLDERARTGRVDLRRFYVRRARRLLPAVLVLTATVACARVALGPWVVGWSTFAPVLLYAGNWIPALGFDPKAFGAMWTLAVEEQFYLVWPLLVVLAGRRSRVVMVAATLAAASLLTRVWLLADGQGWVRIYTGSDAAAFALLVGVVAVGMRAAGVAGRQRSAVRWLALATLLVLCVPQNPWWLTVTFPLTAVVSCVVLWQCTGSGRAIELEGRVLGWFGSRSYGIYLWHAPILWAMADHYHLPWPVLVAFGVPISLGLAEVSYRFIEAPFRARNSDHQKSRPNSQPRWEHPLGLVGTGPSAGPAKTATPPPKGGEIAPRRLPAAVQPGRLSTRL